MTYCVGLKLDKGLVFMSDTRTNSGIDNISTFRKMFIFEEPGERCITIMTAGNLATTQAVVSLPLDLHAYTTGTLARGKVMRVQADNAYFDEISTGWGVALKNAFRELPDFTFPDA